MVDLVQILSTSLKRKKGTNKLAPYLNVAERFGYGGFGTNPFHFAQT